VQSEPKRSGQDASSALLRIDISKRKRRASGSLSGSLNEVRLVVITRGRYAYVLPIAVAPRTERQSLRRVVENSTDKG